MLCLHRIEIKVHSLCESSVDQTGCTSLALPLMEGIVGCKVDLV